MNAIFKNRMGFLITTAVCSIFYATSAEASADTYLGCYKEYGPESVFVIPTSNRINSLTSDGCRENCRKDVIYSFAGLWGGTHCYCASGLNKERIKPINSLFCYLPCRGEPAEFCGGSNASYTFSVYSVCPRGLYGRNCNYKCNCKDNKSCTVHGLCPGDECAVGWKLNRTVANRERCSIAVDVNECQTECRPDSTNPIDCHNCSSALHQECENTKGSFTCICEDGYRKTHVGTCADIDECAKGTHSCSQFCNNTEGSYKCSCPPGYELEGRFDCKVVESGLWSLVVGLGLATGVQFIVIVALAITLCILLARRNLKTTGKEVDEEPCAKMTVEVKTAPKHLRNEYSQFHNP